jgi:hypothetical protein
MSEKPTHTGRLVTDSTGRSRMVYRRTPETEEEMEKIRLGPLALLEPFHSPIMSGRILEPTFVIQTSQDLACRLILARILQDRKPHRVITGTKIISAYLSNESYFDAFSNFAQLFILFGYQEHGNRRLAEFINELVSTRHLEGQHVWLFIPKPLVDMAAQWGDSLLNLKFLPNLQILSEDSMGPVSAGKIDWSHKDPRFLPPPPSYASPPPPSDDNPDPKFSKKPKPYRK